MAGKVQEGYSKYLQPAGQIALEAGVFTAATTGTMRGWMRYAPGMGAAYGAIGYGFGRVYYAGLDYALEKAGCPETEENSTLRKLALYAVSFFAGIFTASRLVPLINSAWALRGVTLVGATAASCGVAIFGFVLVEAIKYAYAYLTAAKAKV